jgi:FtsP/CotA-like multicopper oxidase with cupredoxin domain
MRRATRSILASFASLICLLLFFHTSTQPASGQALKTAIEAAPTAQASLAHAANAIDKRAGNPLVEKKRETNPTGEVKEAAPDFSSAESAGALRFGANIAINELIDDVAPPLDDAKNPALTAIDSGPASPSAAPPATAAAAVASCAHTVFANVVAIDQVYFYNRFGAFNPAGMMYALSRDVEVNSAGEYHLKSTKRPRPIVLRVNEGDCLQVNFTNRLSETPPDDSTATRNASIHVNGMDYVGDIGADGANVGQNKSSLVAPGKSIVYTWYAAKQGQYLIYSMGAPAGGEGDGGQLVLGLFGSVNVEPPNSRWYRSQVTAEQLQAASHRNEEGRLVIDYDALYFDSDVPVLNMLKGNEIIYTDLNAIITDPSGRLQENCTNAPQSSTCGQPFREFTVLFHDEIKAVQAFPKILDQDLFHGVRDGFAINYGSTSLGAELIANRLKVGPAKNCNECKFEEFFLESWVNGDPALIVKKDDQGNAVQALFPDDPSNVHHSYLNDPVRFRNLHAGPKETHVFHLHAHQWLQSPREDGSTYLDSQTISPGAAFTYEINYGGSGNRNINPGDAIFHCHLYPHFAQGMWELWRNHDVFEDGTAARNLPDAEIAGGTPNPAIVPIPNKPLPLMPTEDFKGYPFYIPAEAGHRPPQPPYDSEWDGGLQRHIILKAAVKDGKAAILESNPALLDDPVAKNVIDNNDDPNPFPTTSPLSQEKIVLAFARTLISAKAQFLEPLGEKAESVAIDFHAGKASPDAVPVVTQYGWRAIGYPSSLPDGTADKETLFLVNGLPPQPGAPYADPCPEGTFERPYRAAYIQFDMTINAYKWHDRQARIAILEQDALATGNNPPKPEPLFFRANSNECITFHATNLIPNVLNVDDFQIFTPTDIIGQHIHLVKFDVTSSDGAGNGWNYEDGTFSPDEVRERIKAIRAANGCPPLGPPGPYEEPADPDYVRRCPRPKEHPVFGAGEHGEFLGAQTTIQRWWADPLINNYDGKDRTIRTVFTHDHFGPSSHQHHGLYAALVVEPPKSVWTSLDGNTVFGTRDDGGPTSYAANIIPPETVKPPYREFNLAFGDFAIVYTEDLKPVNPPRRMEAPLPIAIEPPPVPRPESISAADPGTQVVNYRNEPIPLRIGEQNGTYFTQKPGDAGDMARAFNSNVHLDPYTPLLQANEGDRVQVRLIQGAQEEQHVFNIHGQKWLFEPSAPNSGFRNGQQIGISEHFEFEIGPQPERLNKLGRRFTDYLYSSAATDNLWDGQWGILRIYQGRQPVYRVQKAGAAPTTDDLAPLPNNPDGRIAEKSEFFNEVCPVSSKPPVTYTVYALLARDILPQGSLVYNERFRRQIFDPNAIIFVNKEDYDGLQAGTINPEPLILRANAGDCIKVTLYNQLPDELPEQDSWNEVPMIVNHFNFNQIKTSNRVGLHPQLVALDTRTQDGSDVGFNQDSTVGPRESITYTWYAGNKVVGPDGLPAESPIEFGAIGLRDMGDVIKHSSHGAIGSLIIEPYGSHWEIDQSTGTNRAVANIYDKEENLLFREFAVIYQDDLSLRTNTPWCQFCMRRDMPLKNISDTDDSEDTGMKAFNYRTEPFWLRMGWEIDTPEEQQNMADFSNVLSSRDPNPGCNECGDPATPLFTATAGQPVRFRVVHPAGHPRQHGFTVFGHHWNFEPWADNSTRQGENPFTFEVGSYSGIGPTRHDNILTTAGGLLNIPGDYLYRTQESYQFSGGGLWGIFRVYPSEIIIGPPGVIEADGGFQTIPKR